MSNENQSFKSEFLNILSERGFIHQATDMEALDQKMSEGSITAYVGYDMTAPSIHVGNLVSVMMLHWLQKCGHNPIVLLGGGTTRIGDPSGRDETRQMLTDEKIAENMASIRSIFEQFLTFGDNPSDAKLVNNDDWLSTFKYIDFLREIGTHFTINRMLTFDSVKLRLDREQPLTFLEFNYMIMQAYDFMELSKTHGCSLQMGGSDQWGNIVNGIELGRRVNGDQLYGLTTPLITTADGKKMGKSVNGAIWLNEAMLSSYDYWQFWRNTHDGDVGRFLRLYTDLPMDEIRRLEALEGAEINDAKIALANAATAMCRGADAAKTAESTARETFIKGGAGDDLPTFKMDLNASVNIIDAFVEAGLGKSKGEVRRLMKQGGLKLNDTKIETENLVLSSNMLNDGKIKLSAGKKRHALIISE
ncbi:tyrosine--tRNA ligase [Kordiimonas sp. SCSIO 12610]|uniref:tyrosine--tRNA ligase n=1 Tax=Kordiimonas sp. SCSIO 12610 TaxID=2829597 RepID=UPI0021099824|nr:tyrosine--tRNA ligase [Kordiimonas sp. SCSIO 12610]UTW53855.1 tyrosine--tRNA ligase [Kordiimonas sp. SCSIO 12610]